MTRYDDAAAFYVPFADRMLADPQSFWHPLRAFWRGLLGGRLTDRRVLDLAYAEGHFTRLLGELGPREVIGVDLSAELLKVAAARTSDTRFVFRQDDVQTLATFAEASVEAVVSNLALMDIPDHRAMFRAVRRVLVPGGHFVFSTLHPCFESPFHEPDAPRFELDGAGERRANRIERYAQQGHWNSGGSGVRGRVGAYHRTLSTLVNDLLATGFSVQGLHEPVTGSGLHGQVAQVLLIDALKPQAHPA